MLTYSFENIGDCTLYEYLYKCIKNDILSGVMSTNEKLPSKRNLAKNMNISTITVENAYAQLIAEGYIYSLPKKGYYVSDLSDSIAGYSKNISLNKKILSNVNNDNQKTHSILTENNNFYIENSNNEITSNSYIVDLVSNKTQAESFPFSIWAKLMRQIISEKKDELLTNPVSGGILELREAIANHLYQFRGIKVSPKQIIIGAGTEYMYGLLIQLFDQNSIYAVENPGHKKISQIYESHNTNFCNLPLDQYGINMDSLIQSNADILHISPSHHYPTGIVTPINRRYELLKWANNKESRYIIEDDYDCEFRLQGNPIPSLKSIDNAEKVIYINTFSKSLASTIRISYMVLPNHLLDLYYEKLGFYSCTVSNFDQYTLASFINKGYFEKHINRQRNYYKKQRDSLLKCLLNNPLNDKCTITEKDSGLHFLMKIHTNLSDVKFKKVAKKHGLNIAFLSEYYNDNSNEDSHILVINYSGLNETTIPLAVKLLNQCLEDSID